MSKKIEGEQKDAEDEEKEGESNIRRAARALCSPNHTKTTIQVVPAAFLLQREAYLQDLVHLDCT